MGCEGKRRNPVALAGRTLILGLLPVSIFLFLRAIVVRVVADLGPTGIDDLGWSMLPAVALAFGVLFLGGVGYAFWVLLVEHYIALSLTKSWIAQIIRDTQIPGRDAAEPEPRRLAPAGRQKVSPSW